MDFMAYETLIVNLKTAEKGSEQLDQMIWARLTGRGFPLPHYDLDTWEKSYNQGVPEARMSTDPQAVMAWFEKRWPDHRLDMRFEKGLSKIDVLIIGFGTGIPGHFKGKLALSDMARGIAAAALDAHERAVSLEQDILRHNIEEVVKTVAPWGKWEVVKIGDYHHAVDHENRLLGQGVGSPEKVAKWPHRIKDPSVLLSMRERYEQNFPEKEESLQMKKWIVEVTAINDVDEMDPNDRDDDGNCLVDGAYRLHTEGDLAQAHNPARAALDAFHSIVPIARLEDFVIIIRKETEHDAGDGWLRRDLGLYGEVPGPELPSF